MGSLVVIPTLCVFEDLLGEGHVAGIGFDALCGFAETCLFLVSTERFGLDVNVYVTSL